jgi:3-hydroxyisobutyrate dehydrogenase
VTIGVVGIGNMGLGIAQRLIERGQAVQVCDVDPTRAPQVPAAAVAASPAAMSGCELVIVVVVDAAQTRAVLDALPLPAGATVMLCPTIAAEDTEAFAAQLAARGIGCIDAPMSGGPARARDGTMSLMVACSDALFSRWQPLLAHLASRLFRVGTKPGDGARTKLVNNLLAAVNLAGACEVLALAERWGLDAAKTLDVIEQSSGQSWIASDRLRRALAGDTAPRAHVSLLAKDSGLAMAAAGDDAPAVGAAAARLFAQAMAAGLAQEDDGALWRWLSRGSAPPESAP